MISLMLALVLGAAAGPVEDGAALWEAGQGADAVAVWEVAAREGVPSGVLLYNLGVAHYRLGDAPRAAAYLQAARRLRPRDPKLVHNLARARNRIEGAPPPVHAPHGWMELVTVGEMSALALFLSLIAAGGMWWRRLAARDLLRLPWLLTMAAAIAVGLAGATGAWSVANRPVVVVVDAPAVARDAARADASERFVLPPGSEVRVERALGDYLLVRTGRGDRGWIARRRALYIGPPSTVPSG